MGLRISTELDPKGVQQGAAVVKRSLNDVDAAMVRTEKATQKMNFNFGNVGAQLTDISVQLQGGQNPFLVLSQQLPQLIPLSAGLAGAGTALGLSLIGVAESAFRAKDSTKNLAAALEVVDGIVTTTGDGLFTLSEDTRRLANVNVQLADSYINLGRAQAEVAQQQAANVLAETIQKTIDNTLGLTEAITGAKRPTDEQIKTVYELSESFLSLRKGEQLTSDETVRFLQILESVNPETDAARKKLLELRAAVARYAITQAETNEVIKVASEGYAELERSERNSENQTRKKRDAVADLTAQLRVLNVEMEEGARAAAILSEQQRAGVLPDSDRGRKIAELTGKIFDQRAAIKSLAEAEREREKLTKSVERIEFGTLKPIDQLRAEEQKKLDVLTEYAELGAEQQKRAEALRTEVQRQAALERDELSRMEQRNTLSATANGFDALSQLSAQFIGEQDNRNKAAFALSKAFAVASAGVNLALAISQALADPSALTLPQKLANYALIASSGAGLISSISGANYATGGYVQGPGSGTSDSVRANLSNGEFVTRAAVTRRNRGALEYMNRTGEMPGGNGSVVINYYGSGSVEKRQEGGLTIIDIDKRINDRVPGVMAGEVQNPNSQFNKAGRSTYNWQRK